MYAILIAAGILGGLGLLFGIILGVASKIFAVQTDERIEQIMKILPCANCGGCGFAGCSAFADAVVKGKANPNACAVGGAKCAQEVSQIIGVEASFEKKTARVKCSGDCDAAPLRYDYYGPTSCEAAARLGGGPKACSWGCLGLGSCTQVCQFDAIHVVNGVAVVDEEKCTACGKCVSACPKQLISLMPVSKKYYVSCSSQDRGPEMKELCTAGCIGCRLCVKQCEADAISVENNLAKIDASKCTSCGKCAQKCPKGIIRTLS